MEQDYKFLDTNPNPTLGDLLAQFEEVEKTTKPHTPNLTIFTTDLKHDIEKSSIPKGILILIQQLQELIENKDFLGAKDKIINGLKRIKLLKEHHQIQQKIDAIYNEVDKAIAQATEQKYEVTPNKKALYLLAELVYLNKSTDTPITVLKDELTVEAFTLYVAFVTIECVNGDGWAFGIFGNNPQLVPYISDALEALGYRKVPEAIRDTINIFPKDTNFLFDDGEYTDVLNFIENPRRKVDNPKLNKYTKEERIQFCENYHQSIQKIEELESEIWNGDNEWETIFDYYIVSLRRKYGKLSSGNGTMRHYITPITSFSH